MPSSEPPPLDAESASLNSSLIQQLKQQIQQLQQDKADLEILLETATEHATAVETDLAKADAELRRALEQERQLNQRIEELATLEERNRIAREIHDSLGHLLVGLNVQMETALALWDEQPDRALTFLTKAKQLGSEALAATRQSVADLRFDPLAGRSLEAGIAALATNFYETTAIRPTYQMQLDAPPSHRVSSVLYRIVQEGLTNVCKHAQATAVTIQLQSSSTELSLVLQDNGQGFDPQANRSGFGLQGMQERITALGGNLAISSNPGSGCCIRVTLPSPSGVNTPAAE
jgi:two-component system, sensor histidine kinase and response regulator